MIGVKFLVPSAIVSVTCMTQKDPSFWSRRIVASYMMINTILWILCVYIRHFHNTFTLTAPFNLSFFSFFSFCSVSVSGITSFQFSCQLKKHTTPKPSTMNMTDDMTMNMDDMMMMDMDMDMTMVMTFSDFDSYKLKSKLKCDFRWIYGV